MERSGVPAWNDFHALVLPDLRFQTPRPRWVLVAKLACDVDRETCLRRCPLCAVRVEQGGDLYVLFLAHHGNCQCQHRLNV